MILNIKPDFGQVQKITEKKFHQVLCRTKQKYMEIKNYLKIC